MIALDLNLAPVRANAVEPVVQAVAAGDTSDPEVRPPARGIVSNPLAEWLAIGPNVEAMASCLELRIPDFQWSSEREQRFAQLVEREAVAELTTEEELELEHLSILRRGTKNPRLGEELVWEYEQREVTRDLIKALDRYVSFHKTTNHP